MTGLEGKGGQSSHQVGTAGRRPTTPRFSGDPSGPPRGGEGSRRKCAAAPAASPAAREGHAARTPRPAPRPAPSAPRPAPSAPRPAPSAPRAPHSWRRPAGLRSLQRQRGHVPLGLRRLLSAPGRRPGRPLLTPTSAAAGPPRRQPWRRPREAEGRPCDRGAGCTVPRPGWDLEPPPPAREAEVGAEPRRAHPTQPNPARELAWRCRRPWQSWRAGPARLGTCPPLGSAGSSLSSDLG
nr:translation initiation factor IF-2-like [Macaca fascicularis]